MKLAIWMVIILGLNWGGFVYLLVRASKKKPLK
jgi:hypothetical protein